MTKKKKVVSKILLAVLVLTLISFCFLGNTFARYVSDGTGTASMTVAKWDVSHGEGEITVDFNELSPSMEEYGAPTARTHSTGKVAVATLSNNGAVGAKVNFAAGSLTVTGSGYGTGVKTDDPTEAEVKEVFSIKLYKGTDASTPTDEELGSDIELAAGESMYVFAEVTWTSDTNIGSENEISGDTADKRDTFIGENVTEIVYTISYTAVQNTESPAN